MHARGGRRATRASTELPELRPSKRKEGHAQPTLSLFLRQQRRRESKRHESPLLGWADTCVVDSHREMLDHMFPEVCLPLPSGSLFRSALCLPCCASPLPRGLGYGRDLRAFVNFSNNRRWDSLASSCFFVRFSVSLLALARGLGLTSELAPSLLALVMWVRPRKEWDAGSGRAVWVHELAVVKPSPTPWITSSSL